jgi:hypothetical protein
MADQEYLAIPYLTRREIARIFKKITVDDVTGCWNWTGETVQGGYGRTRFRGTKELTHRILFAWRIHALPKGRGKYVPQLDHIRCNNPRCCNPAHVCLVSPRQNILRGNAPAAINFRKDFCIHGHPLYLIPDGSRRRCPICDNETLLRRKRIRRRRTLSRLIRVICHIQRLRLS